MELRIKRLHPDAILPTRARPGDSGLDLYALLPDGPCHLAQGERKLFWTGIAVELPEGTEGQVRPRSGLTSQGIVAAFGTIDSTYRGDIGVTLFNNSFRPIAVRQGDRIAQLVVAPVLYPTVIEVSELSETERGAGGFGSTGV